MQPQRRLNNACGSGDNGNNLADADPQFVDTGHANLRLASGSPGIDAGSNDPYNGGLRTDLNGDPRKVGTYTDLGPFELKRIYVDRQATAGLNDGSSWENAYTDLQGGLAAATRDSEIWVAKGTYKPSAAGDPNANFSLKTGAMIYGGFAGTETARKQRDRDTKPTILSGDLNADDGPDFSNTDDNSVLVTRAESVDTSAILDGFTITGGNGHTGGGMYIRDATPTLNHLIFLKNQASSSGGGLYNHLGNPVLSNVTFSGNAGGFGGGFYNEAGNPSLTGVTFLGNTAEHLGGGMASSQANNLILDRVVFSGNTSPNSGGGLALQQTNAQLTNVVFTNNTAWIGGGLFNTSGSSATLTHTTFWGNVANPGYGGGIYNTSGGGPSGSSVTIRNSILWGDVHGEVHNLMAAPASSATMTYSLAQGCNQIGVWNNACGTNGGNNLTDADPSFVDTAQGNLHLRKSSPAIDRGYLGYAIDILKDLDGNPRIQNGVVDLGAYEYKNVLPQLTNFSKNGFINQDITFSASDFTTHFSDPNADELVSVWITSLPDHGTLFLSTSPVERGQEIPAGSLGDLRFAPEAGWAGQSQFTWSATDGEGYVPAEARIDLTIVSSEPVPHNLFLPSVIR